MPAPHHSVFYRPDALPAAQSQRQSTEGKSTGNSVVKVDRRIRWHYTTTILRLRIGVRLTRYRNCKFHNGCRAISRHADGISRYSVPPSAGPLLPLPGIDVEQNHVTVTRCTGQTSVTHARVPLIAENHLSLGARDVNATKQTVSPPPLRNAPPLPRKLSPPGRPTHAQADGQAGNITLKILCNGKRCMSCNL